MRREEKRRMERREEKNGEKKRENSREERNGKMRREEWRGQEEIKKIEYDKKEENSISFPVFKKRRTFITTVVRCLSWMKNYPIK